MVYLKICVYNNRRIKIKKSDMLIRRSVLNIVESCVDLIVLILYAQHSFNNDNNK